MTDTDFKNELDLLEEYNQWRAVKSVAQQDTSPEEFMRDRVRQVAFERVEQTLKYMIEANPVEISAIKEILEGTSEYK